jgi:hypothetical protein
MARPVTLCTGQWADCELARQCHCGNKSANVENECGKSSGEGTVCGAGKNTKGRKDTRGASEGLPHMPPSYLCWVVLVMAVVVAFCFPEAARTLSAGLAVGVFACSIIHRFARFLVRT